MKIFIPMTRQNETLEGTAEGDWNGIHPVIPILASFVVTVLSL
jgi:hypothetical protein